MKTYSQSKGKKFIDWNKRLSKKKITNEMWLKWKDDAGNWVTCACGNQCDMIPRNKNGKPKDVILRLRGMEFYAYIAVRDLSSSKEILKKIEARSILLINQIKKHDNL